MADDRSELARILIEGAEPSMQPNKLAGPWGGLKSYMPEQPELMKSIQNALGRGLAAIPPEAALAIRARQFPTTAAVRFGDQTFTGPNHATALMKADLGSVPPGAAMSDGFLTNWGRFVSREEAASLLGAKPQPDRYGLRRFHSDQLNKPAGPE